MEEKAEKEGKCCQEFRMVAEAEEENECEGGVAEKTNGS
jgi:hypothetical protein